MIDMQDPRDHRRVAAMTTDNIRMYSSIFRYFLSYLLYRF